MSRLEHGKKKCKHSPSIKEEFLISAVTEAANSMITDMVYAKEILKGAIAEVMGDNMQNKMNENSARINELNEKLSQTLSKNLDGEISIEEMDKIFSEIRDEQLRLRHENDAYEKRRQIESADHEKRSSRLSMRCLKRLTDSKMTLSECCSTESKSYPKMKCESARETMSIPSICKTEKII